MMPALARLMASDSLGLTYKTQIMSCDRFEVVGVPMFCPRILVSVLLSRWVVTASAQTKSQTICDSKIDLCFEGFHDTETNVTLGFILPSNPGAADTFIAIFSFPLPYGFAAFTVGQAKFETSRFGERAIAASPVPLIFAFPPEINQRSLQLSNMVAPLASFTSNKALIPSETANLTISNKSTVTKDGATAILLCKACMQTAAPSQQFFSTNFPLVTVLLQDDTPLYLGPELSDTILPLLGAESKQFVFDRNAARAPHFDDNLRQAGFDE